ncbi:MAG: hypothetical protein OEV87_04585 [Phycisphaerae bacterium]|nr:hypothetical protein [Phycisphaerae bacterium]
MKNGNEKLDELLRRFMDEAHIRDLKADLDFADHVFSAYPVPAVRQEALASIQAKIRQKLIHRRFLTAGRWIAAAAILIVAVLSRNHFVNNPNRITPFSAASYNTEDIWKDDFYAMNSQVDSIEQELTELARSARPVRLETYDTTDAFSLDMMELDEIEHLADNASLGKDIFYAQ